MSAFTQVGNHGVWVRPEQVAAVWRRRNQVLIRLVGGGEGIVVESVSTSDLLKAEQARDEIVTLLEWADDEAATP